MSLNLNKITFLFHFINLWNSKNPYKHGVTKISPQKRTIKLDLPNVLYNASQLIRISFLISTHFRVFRFFLTEQKNLIAKYNLIRMWEGITALQRWRWEKIYTCIDGFKENGIIFSPFWLRYETIMSSWVRIYFIVFLREQVLF